MFLSVMGLLSFSCHKQNKKNIENGLFTKNIIVENVTRKYAVYIPQNIENILCPLVFALHGGGGNIDNMTGENGYKAPFKVWMDIADTEKIIIVYPEGLNGSSGKPTWNDCRGNCSINSNADDVEFISVLIDEMKTNYDIDLSRVYVTGFSNGGIMSLRLATELSDRLAAVASVSGGLPDISKCQQPQNPISVLFMNGTADLYLPYNGGTIGNPPNEEHGSVYSIENSVNFWVNLNQTDTIPDIYNYPDLDPDDGGNVIRYKYMNGLKGTEVVLYKINGGGHLAPSLSEQYSNLIEKIFGKQNHDIEMSAEIWNFFTDKTLD